MANDWKKLDIYELVVLLTFVLEGLDKKEQTMKNRLKAAFKNTEHDFVKLNTAIQNSYFIKKIAFNIIKTNSKENIEYFIIPEILKRMIDDLYFDVYKIKDVWKSDLLSKAFFVFVLNNFKKYSYLFNKVNFNSQAVINGLIDYIKNTNNFSILNIININKLALGEKLANEIIDYYSLTIDSFNELVFFAKIIVSLPDISFLYEDSILQISILFFYDLDVENLNRFSKKLRNNNYTLYLIPEALKHLLEKDAKGSAENFAKFIEIQKKSGFTNRFIKRSIIIFYAVYLLYKYKYFKEFNLLKNLIFSDANKTNQGKIIKELLFNKKITTYFIHDIDLLNAHIEFYIVTLKLYDKKISLDEKSLLHNLDLLNIPFFKIEQKQCNKNNNKKIISFCNLIKNINFELEDTLLEEFKKILKKETENKSELIWVIDSKHILPYQKKQLVNGKYSFKPLVDYYGRIKNYNWFTEEDKITVSIFNENMNSTGIFYLTSNHDKIYYRKKDNFYKVSVKNARPLLLGMLDDKNLNIIFYKAFVNSGNIINRVSNTLIINNNIPNILEKTSNYFKALPDNSDFYHLKLNEKNSKEILSILSKYFAFYLNSNNRDFIPFDKQISYENEIHMYISKLDDHYVANFFIVPFDEQQYFYELTNYTYLLINRADKIYIIDLNNPKIRKINSKIQNLITSKEFLIKTKSFDKLLGIISEFKSLDFVKIVVSEELLFKDIHKVTLNDFDIQEKLNGNYLEISGEIQINDKKIIKFSELLDSIFEQNGNFIKLKNKEYIELDEQLIEELKKINAVSYKNKDKILIHKNLKPFIENQSKNTLLSKSNLAQQIAEIENKIYSIPDEFKGILRAYQIDGFTWFTKMYELKFGACLADDMGLGKTVQTIAFLEKVKNNAPYLVVAPVSLMYNWEREIIKFSENLNPIIYHNYKNLKFEKLKGCDVVLISYGLLINSINRLREIDFNVIVFDEGQMMKNTSTLRSKAAKELKAEQKIILTGTPIENNLMELWNLMDIINPGLLGSNENFKNKFSNKNKMDSKKLEVLKQVIKPFILRRMKQDVLKELPKKTEIVIDYELSEDEQAFYIALQKKAKANLIKMKSSNDKINNVSILSEIVRLKLACCHPKLIDQEITIENSTKEQIFFQLIKECISSGHKVLVFSQFVKFLTILKDDMKKEKISYFYMDGTTKLKERKRIVDKFQSDNNTKIFLLSLKTGGLGLNLTAADIVIHLDPWWNPATEEQASDRVYRIGQDKPVTVYKLIAKNTLEEKILYLQNEKKQLANFILENMDKAYKVSIDDLMKLLY